MWIITTGRGGAKSNIGIRNFKKPYFTLQKSQVIKMGKICLNQLLTHIHPVSPTLMPNAHILD